MRSILYIQLDDKKDIPDFELYQILNKLYKIEKKKIVLVKINKRQESSLSFELIKMESNSDLLVDGVVKEDFIKPIENNSDEIISGVIKDLEKEYAPYILLTNLSQVKFLTNFINQMITIKKEEIVQPL